MWLYAVFLFKRVRSERDRGGLFESDVDNEVEVEFLRQIEGGYALGWAQERRSSPREIGKVAVWLLEWRKDLKLTRSMTPARKASRYRESKDLPWGKCRQRE
jgi:hypothetical protein